MKRINKKSLFLLCVVSALFPAFNVSAQTPISFADMDSPAFRPGYSPESVSSQATMGTTDTEMDAFMSVYDWSALKPQKSFFSVGFTESPFTGLNAGLGLNLGKVYLGIAYSGDVLSMPLWYAPEQPFIPKDTETSDNTLDVLFGTGIFGIKVGFSEFIEKTYKSGKSETLIQESSFKPSLEVGANLVFDKFRLKPALRLAWDIHHYDSTLEKVLKLDYSEPAVGATIGFDFDFGGTKKLGFDIIGDVAWRMYDLGTGATAQWTVPTQKTYEASEVTDLRITGSLPIAFSASFADRIIFGIKLRADVEFDRLKLVQTDSADAQTKLVLAPVFGTGLRFNLLPDHFAVYGGIEIPVFAPAPLIDTTQEDSFDPQFVPNVKLAVGLTVNFTKNAALEMMVNVPIPATVREVDPPKFSLLFSIKKAKAAQVNPNADPLPPPPQAGSED